MIGFVCLCAAFFAMLTLIALRVRVGSRFYRGMRRAHRAPQDRKSVV